MNEKEVAELEREIQERYEQDRKDLDAIRRVRQMLAARNQKKDHSQPIERTSRNDFANSSPDTTDLAELPEQDSLIARVAALFSSNPTKPFSIAGLEKILRESGFVFQAARPSSSLHTAIRKLRQKGQVRIYRKGSGNQAAYYISTNDLEAEPTAEEKKLALNGRVA